MSTDPTLGVRVTAQEWGGACTDCRTTWAWPRSPKQTRTADLLAGRCPRCESRSLRAATGQAAYETVRIGRLEMQVDRCQVTAGCVLPNHHNQRSGWPCRGQAGRL